MRKLAKSKVKELLVKAGGATVTRMWNRGSIYADFNPKQVPDRMSGWRGLIKDTGHYVTFEGGSSLHPSTATQVHTEGSRLIVEWDFMRIEYDLGQEITELGTLRLT
jgi:hypothetical protein